MAIRSFADKGSADIANRLQTKAARKALPIVLHAVALEKLILLDAATTLEDLSVWPSLQLEKLKGDRRGQYSGRRHRDPHRIPNYPGPPDAFGPTRIDARGMTVMPGLIDCHVHLTSSAQSLQQRGAKVEDVQLNAEMFRPQAEDRVALGLIVGELVRTEVLQARPEQVKAMVQEIAQTYEQPEAVVRWHFEKRERLSEFEALAVELNVVDWVLARARVNDVPTSFEALMAPAAS